MILPQKQLTCLAFAGYTREVLQALQVTWDTGCVAVKVLHEGHLTQ